MSEYVFKMPDLGEGTIEAEIVRWYVEPGDVVAEDQSIVEVMTDKATVEVPAPVGGRVVKLSGEAGEKVPVGAPLIVFETGAAAEQAPMATAAPARAPAAAPVQPATLHTVTAAVVHPARVMASPATRRRAREAGIELAGRVGSGPGGRILQGDLSALSERPQPQARRAPATPDAPAAAQPVLATTEIKVTGLRRVIAERMSEAKRNIPHFAYVEEVDITELESLRRHLNANLPAQQAPLTYLPFVVIALTRVLESFPQCNVRHDAARGMLVRHRSVHVGIATQTPDGLKVPVVRGAEALSLWDLAAEIRRLSERAKTNRSSREELQGSTITVTSLGKLGGIASTPIINAPEVAIIGLNKAVERPVVLNGAVAVRLIMNLSSSFDHRFVDGYEAAAMIQALKARLEYPATLFIPKD